MKIKKLTLTLEFTLDSIYEKEELDWLISDILMGNTERDGYELILHSNEIGDEIGLCKVLNVKEN